MWVHLQYCEATRSVNTSRKSSIHLKLLVSSNSYSILYQFLRCTSPSNLNTFPLSSSFELPLSSSFEIHSNVVIIFIYIFFSVVVCRQTAGSNKCDLVLQRPIQVSRILVFNAVSNWFEQSDGRLDIHKKDKVNIVGGKYKVKLGSNQYVIYEICQQREPKGSENEGKAKNISINFSASLHQFNSASIYVELFCTYLIIVHQIPLPVWVKIDWFKTSSDKKNPWPIHILFPKKIL